MIETDETCENIFSSNKKVYYTNFNTNNLDDD